MPKEGEENLKKGELLVEYMRAKSSPDCGAVVDVAKPV
jgi:hypothetical protein